MVEDDRPSIVVLGGPNGAGKSTAAGYVLREALAVDEFVNADVIAQGLAGFNVGAVALEAGRLMLQRLDELAGQRTSFAFETTLASRSFAPWLRERLAEGYQVHLVFLWLPSAEVAVSRVAGRVARGGHEVPVDTIRRRYAAGLRNFFELYQPQATTWTVYDTSEPDLPRVVATGGAGVRAEVIDQSTWALMVREWAYP
jgi:predicted ABC-type ATPase